MKKGKLESVNFKPRNHVDEYLVDEYLDKNHNTWILDELTKYGGLLNFDLVNLNPEYLIEDLFKPLKFFNLLYESYEIVKENKHKPTALRSHFETVNGTVSKLKNN